MLIGKIDFLDCTGGGLDGCGVRLEVSSLSDELEPSDDGILMVSFGGMELHPTLVFFFFGKEEGMIG